MTAHAKNYPPSSMKRSLPCPFSATAAQLYDREDTEQSLKGDMWHELLEDLLRFGTLSVHCDADAAEQLQDVYTYVSGRFKELGPETKILIEQRIDITETGEFGTADVVLISPEWLEIGDEKSGYVVVDVNHNAQMLTYLCGVIDTYGPRKHYRLWIHQPNYDHVDGPLRMWEPTEQDIAEHRARMRWMVANPDHVQAGPHCKETYCDHRGACEAFRVYCQTDLALGWHSSELKTMDDLKLAAALDASDQLAGWRTELRTEAMRRIMNMDRTVPGYKVVKGRRQRAVIKPRDLVLSVVRNLNQEWAAKLFPDLTWVDDIEDALGRYAHTGNIPEAMLKNLGTPKHIEDVIKQYARVHHLPRGGWKALYDNVVGEYIRETASGLTLEKAIDGRPAHRRGSEFGEINPANVATVITL